MAAAYGSSAVCNGAICKPWNHRSLLNRRLVLIERQSESRFVELLALARQVIPDGLDIEIDGITFAPNETHGELPVAPASTACIMIAIGPENV